MPIKGPPEKLYSTVSEQDGGKLRTHCFPNKQQQAGGPELPVVRLLLECLDSGCMMRWYGLFAAGHRDALDELFLEQQIQMTMGIMASRLPAIRTGKLVVYWPFRVDRPAERVIMFRSVLQISGHIRSE